MVVARRAAAGLFSPFPSFARWGLVLWSRAPRQRLPSPAAAPAVWWPDRAFLGPELLGFVGVRPWRRRGGLPSSGAKAVRRRVRGHGGGVDECVEQRRGGAAAHCGPAWWLRGGLDPRGPPRAGAAPSHRRRGRGPLVRLLLHPYVFMNAAEEEAGQELVLGPALHRGVDPARAGHLGVRQRPLNTWFRNGKLFPGPYLFAGAAITVLWAPSGSPAGMPLEGVIQIEKPDDAAAESKLVSYAKVGLLASGDLLCLLVFSAIGRVSHGLPVLDAETFKTADPFIAGWLLSAYLLGGFGVDAKGRIGVGEAFVVAAKSWVVGIPVVATVSGEGRKEEGTVFTARRKI